MIYNECMSIVSLLLVLALGLCIRSVVGYIRNGTFIGSKMFIIFLILSLVVGGYIVYYLDAGIIFAVLIGYVLFDLFQSFCKLFSIKLDR